MISLKLRSTKQTPVAMGVREFTRNLTSVKKRLAKQLVLVMKNNQPNFVALDPRTYEEINEILEDMYYSRLFNEVALTRKGNFISWEMAKKRLKSIVCS